MSAPARAAAAADGDDEVRAQPATAPGLRLIIVYKWAKAAVEIALAAVLFYGASHWLDAQLAGLARRLREHAVHPWSLGLAARWRTSSASKVTGWVARGRGRG